MKEISFLESFSKEIIPGRPAIIGCPLDLTSTYRSGSAYGPVAIRAASDSIETYSPVQDRDLQDSPFSDLGDIRLPDGSVEASLEAIRKRVYLVMRHGSHPLCLGGEHTVTLGIVRAVKVFYPDLLILHVDAHADLRAEYEGSFINHATVMRRVEEIVGPDGLLQLGVRAGTREEFAWMRENETLLRWGPAAEKILETRLDDRPVYLSLDLDVLDPSCVPGTGNPEPGGWFYNDVERLLRAAARMNLVAADVVELSPSVDPSDASSITAAKIVRELLLVMGKRSNEVF